MAITVYFSTGSKRENSTKQLTMTVTHDCVFKNGCNMLNPTLLLEIDAETFPNYTAFKIENRHYKITNIASIRDNLFEIYGTIDVLATYKDEILASTQYVSYSSVNGDTWLADTRIPLLKNETVAKKATTMNFLFTDTGFYVLSAIGKTACDVWIFDNLKLAALLDRITGWSDDLINEIIDAKYPWSNNNVPWSTYDFSSPEKAIESLALMNTLTGFAGNAYSDAPSCIRSCIWVPFFIGSFSDGADDVYLGQFPTGVRTQKCKTVPLSNSVSVEIPWQHEDWRRAVCEEVYLYIPLVGMVNIPSDEIVNETQLTVEWSATATDGCIAYRVLAGSQVVGTYGASCAINYPIGVSQQSSAGEIAQTAFKGTQKTVSSAISALSPNPIQMAGGIANSAFNLIDTQYQVINSSLTCHNSCIGGIGGGAGVGLELGLECYTVSHDTIIQPSEMEVTMGLPTMKPMRLTNCTGYCKCTNAYVECAATDVELKTITAYLNNGFFIE